jgi:hypothetical protein
VAKLKVYLADVDRDGTMWRAGVPEVQRTTQARNPREVEPIARDLVGITEDVRPDSFRVKVRVNLPAEVQAKLERSADLREQTARNQAEAAALARRAARHLRDQGLPLRDVGQVLGVALQRAKQLIDEANQLAG